MNQWLIYHLASGHAFFSGVALLVLAAWTGTGASIWHKRCCFFSIFLGCLFVTLSSTAISYFYYVFLILCSILWLLSCYLPHWKRSINLLFVAVWLGAVLLELPYHFWPKLEKLTTPQLCIVGDSVTAGMGGDDKSETWPKLIAKTHNVQIQDLSHVGETAGSALKRIQKHEIAASLIIIEIGGNDLMGYTSNTKFAKELEMLLYQLQNEERQLLMFELPLPPFYFEYGRIQRVLAEKYRVKLIPKRVFLSILTDPQATVDGVHLSQAGHQRMAKIIGDFIEPKLP